MVVRQGQVRRIGCVIKRVEAQVGQILLGYKYPVSRGIVVQEQDTFGKLPVFFLHLHQQRLVILGVDSLAFWKAINKEDAVFIPKNRGENFPSGLLH